MALTANHSRANAEQVEVTAKDIGVGNEIGGVCHFAPGHP